MSIVLKVADLSPVQMEKISNQLKVHQQPTFFGKNNFYKNKNNLKDDIELTIYHGEYVRVPYNFGVQLLGYNPQIEIWRRHHQYPLKFKGTLKDYQREICAAAGKHLENNRTTLLNVFASAGKTIMATYLACKCDYLRIIVYPGIDLGKQWAKTIKNFTSCSNNNNDSARVWTIGDPVPDHPVDFILCPITRIEKIDPKGLSRIGMLIIDEFHMLYTQKRIRELLKLSPKYIIGCTATLGKKKEIAHLMCGPEYIFMKSKKPFTVYKFHTGLRHPEQKNKSDTLDWAKFVDSQVNNPIRNEQIIGLCVTNPDKKICIMGWRKEHATHLHDTLRKLNQSVDIMIGNKREYNDSRILCGTINKIGTGFDEENACANFGGMRINLLIMVGSMRNEVLIEQTAGRCFRSEFPNIIYFVDDNEISHAHWEVAKEWFESRNGTVVEVHSEYAKLVKDTLLVQKEKRKRKKEEEIGIVRVWDGKRIGDYSKSKSKYQRRDTGPVKDASDPSIGIPEKVTQSEISKIEDMTSMLEDMGYF